MARTVDCTVIDVVGVASWRWHVHLDPTGLQPNVNRAVEPMELWCYRQWGERDVEWGRVAHNFLFHTPEHAMMFKLAWHNVELQ